MPSKNRLNYALIKAGVYLALVVPICGACFLLFEKYGEPGVYCAIPIAMIWVHLLVSSDDDKNHDFIRKLVMRYRHYLKM